MVNTVAVYRSPVRLVEYAMEDAGSYSSQAISRARKKMMAEIALAGDEIVIDNVAYSRNDASTLLDFITESNWKVHRIIYSHKGLLNFLEKEEFSDEELKKADAYLYNSSFVQAVSPYFAYSFNAVSGRLLRQQDFAELTRLMDYQGYVLPEHSDEAYRKIRTYIDDLVYTLRNLSWEKFIADEGILHFVFDDEWKRFINKLPASFTSLRDELVEQMTGIVLRFQHKATWYYLHQVLVQLKVIETNDFNRSEVERIDKVIYQNSQVEGGKGRRNVSDNGEISTGRIIWWVIWIVLIIVRVTTCNSNKSSNNDYSFNYDQIKELQERQEQYRSPDGRKNEQRNEKNVLTFLDSLSKSQLLVSPPPAPMQTGDLAFSSFANIPDGYGTADVAITNNTSHNCVLIYFDGQSKQGSVYEGALSNTVSIYIKKGDTYRFKTEPGAGRMQFLFGDDWGRLRKQAELPMSNHYGYSHAHKLFIYEFFKPDKSLNQKYLKRSIWLDDPSAKKNSSEYLYLNKPDFAQSDFIKLTLAENNNTFSVKAEGGLLVKEDRSDKRSVGVINLEGPKEDSGAPPLEQQ